MKISQCKIGDRIKLYLDISGYPSKDITTDLAPVGTIIGKNLQRFDWIVGWKKDEPAPFHAWVPGEDEHVGCPATKDYCKIRLVNDDMEVELVASTPKRGGHTTISDDPEEDRLRNLLKPHRAPGECACGIQQNLCTFHRGT